jgi:D-alanyl-D-alanine carboxypeptidase
VRERLEQIVRIGLFLVLLLSVLPAVPQQAEAAPYAAMVMDARTGEVLHARNADTQLHPASLTKMMTLYIAFEAVERGEISLDDMVTISAKAAGEPPSKLGLREGQRVRLRYLIRAAAVKSANDAATAIAEAISGSEAAFALRMNRTAAALGMTRSHFVNAHGLTASGHLSTARDMTLLGRRLFYDYPAYYNLFSRRTADAGVREVNNTNSRFLDSYEGADGIKTGYTRAAGYNLVASAERGGERIIATVFGGRSVAARNSQVAELLDLGFRRAPTRVAARPPEPPVYDDPPAQTTGAGKTIRLVTAVAHSPRPVPRPRPADTALPPGLLSEVQQSVAEAVAGADEQATLEEEPATPIETKIQDQIITAETPEDLRVTQTDRVDPPTERSVPVPETIVLATLDPSSVPASDDPEIVTRLSSSGGRHWGVTIGRFGTRHQAERELLQTALKELGTLEDALRNVVGRNGGFDANFMGLTQEAAELTCRRLEARNQDCTVLGPS